MLPGLVSRPGTRLGVIAVVLVGGALAAAFGPRLTRSTSRAAGAAVLLHAAVRVQLGRSGAAGADPGDRAGDPRCLGGGQHRAGADETDREPPARAAHGRRRDERARGDRRRDARAPRRQRRHLAHRADLAREPRRRHLGGLDRRGVQQGGARLPLDRAGLPRRRGDVLRHRHLARSGRRIDRRRQYRGEARDLGRRVPRHGARGGGVARRIGAPPWWMRAGWGAGVALLLLLASNIVDRRKSRVPPGASIPAPPMPLYERTDAVREAVEISGRGLHGGRLSRVTIARATAPAAPDRGRWRRRRDRPLGGGRQRAQHHDRMRRARAPPHRRASLRRARRGWRSPRAHRRGRRGRGAAGRRRRGALLRCDPWTRRRRRAPALRVVRPERDLRRRLGVQLRAAGAPGEVHVEVALREPGPALRSPRVLVRGCARLSRAHRSGAHLRLRARGGGDRPPGARASRRSGERRRAPGGRLHPLLPARARPTTTSRRGTSCST